jgi:hypothetical protein
MRSDFSKRLREIAQALWSWGFKSFGFSASIHESVATALPIMVVRHFMNTLEVRPELHVQEQHQRPEFATCDECYRSFRPKTEDQFCLQLCDRCFESVRHASEKVVSVHIKVLPHKSALL